ncbi:MAG: FAD-binding protein [Planctomycetota bacterium]|nr:MAG: FAD-binding protein [Planctomycetota bacterium]
MPEPGADNWPRMPGSTGSCPGSDRATACSWSARISFPAPILGIRAIPGSRRFPWPCSSMPGWSSPIRPRGASGRNALPSGPSIGHGRNRIVGGTIRGPRFRRAGPETTLSSFGCDDGQRRRRRRTDTDEGVGMSAEVGGGDVGGRHEGSPFDDLAVAVGEGEPLAPHTWLGVGGPAAWFCEPVDVAALGRVVKRCQERSIPLRVIGGGSNVLVPAAGFAGMVVRLSAPAFSTIEVQGSAVLAGAGAKLVHVVAAAVQAGLSGLETLVGIPGTVGGALVGNAGGRGGDIGDTVRSVTVMNPDGSVVERGGAELTFGSRWSNLDDVIVIGCRLELEAEDADLLTKRMQKRWIVDRTEQPAGVRTVAMMFKDPHGSTAEALVTQAGAREIRVGEASIHGPRSNYVVAQPGCTSDDVRLLVEQVRARVRERLGVELTPQIELW